jgi:hypothetical protein
MHQLCKHLVQLHFPHGLQGVLADAEARSAQLHMQLLAASSREEELTQVVEVCKLILVLPPYLRWHCWLKRTERSPLP